MSVIIPTYNREKYVAKAIDSVLSQKFEDYEIIVVDDGSTDNTKETLRGFKDKIKYIYQDNSGVSAARNTGIRHASGEWLAFLDSDDEWMPDYLLTQFEKVNQNPRICMQTTDCLITELNGKMETYFNMNGSLAELKGKDYLFVEKPFSFVVRHNPWQLGGIIIRHEAIRKTRLFDTNFTISEDLDLMSRTALHGPFGMINKTLVNIYRRDETIDYLTKQAWTNPIGVREINERVYEKLKKIETLGYKDIRALNDLLSANRRGIGNLFLENGEIKEARNSYRRALFYSPSIASLIRYILSFLPAKANLWLTEMNFKLKEKKRKC